MPDILKFSILRYFVLSYFENKIALHEYLDKNEATCKTRETFPVILKDNREVLDVYLIPLDYLIFNIKNGRFKAEYLEKKRENGGKDLDPTTSKDKKIIQKLLLDLDPLETQRTMDDIRALEQKIPGIMTWDGAVIDGNRRLSILMALSLENKKFSVMRIARLPEDVDQDDLWKLEAGIQLGKDEIVRYKPINELLKLKEGKDAKIPLKEIAKNLYGIDSEKEIEKKLERLKLIEKYLAYIGSPLQYKKIDNKMEQFIEAQKIMPELETLEDTYDKRDLSNAIFELIRRGKSFDDIRLAKRMIKNPSGESVDILKQIGKTALKSKREIDEFSTTRDDDKPSISDDVSTLWTDAVQEQQAEENKGNIPRLLTNAFTNLDKINFASDKLKETQSQEIIQKLIRHLESLKKLVK
jgi:hypothetical protein